MTMYPDESSTEFATAHFSYKNWDGNVTPYTQSDSYISSYRHRGGGNSPSWPSLKSENGFYHHYLEYKKAFVQLDISGPLDQRFFGENVQPCSGPTEGTEGVLWTPRSAALAVNRSQLVNRLLTNLSQNKTNVAQFIAEREQTANLIASTARRLAQAIENLRRGNVVGVAHALFGTKNAKRGIKRVAGGIPEQWLALQYGWKPLLSDVYGSCEELAALTTGVQPEVFTVTATAQTNFDRSTYVSGGDGGWIPPVEWSSSSGAVRGKALVAAKVSSDFVTGASRTGLINPLTLGWELLPYSFVVDWFYPVGDFLERCNATDGLTFSRGYITQKYNMNWRAALKGSPNFSGTPGWSGSVSGGNHTAMFSGYSREVLSWFPSPSWPSFKDPFSPTHVANGLSLLATAFGRGPRVR